MKQLQFRKSRLEVQSSATAGANRSQGGVRVMHSNASRDDKQCIAITCKSMALSKQD